MSTLHVRLDGTLSPGAESRFAALNRECRRWWRLACEGSPVLPAMLAVPLVLGLLLAFYYVVSEGKQQAELRQKTMALHAVAALRCNTLPGVAARDMCLFEVNSSGRNSSGQ